MKLNCWEYKKCGRHPGGPKTAELGVCPAADFPKATGIHGGKNAGRACWAVGGTLCGGTVQGTFAAKVGNCLKCDFYVMVRNEEGAGFVQAADILKRLR